MPRAIQKETKKKTLSAPKSEKQRPKAAVKESKGEKLQKQGKPLKDKGRIRIIPLGGLQEIGKNLTVIEYENDMIVVDCGLAFPEEDMLGVDLVIPDITYLENNREKIRGIVLTHGHEDHIGAIPYVLRQINPPIYGTKLTLGIIKNKLSEHMLPYEPDLRCVEAGDTVKLGVFSVEFIHTNHSIADACCLAITTPLGVVVHTGDFKLDITPIDGEMMKKEVHIESAEEQLSEGVPKAMMVYKWRTLDKRIKELRANLATADEDSLGAMMSLLSKYQAARVTIARTMGRLI